MPKTFKIKKMRHRAILFLVIFFLTIFTSIAVSIALESNNDTSTVCIALYDPVCGTDGKTYSNDCYAKSAGVNVAYQGVCTENKLVSAELSPKVQYANAGEEKIFILKINDMHPVLVQCIKAPCGPTYTYKIKAYPIYTVPVEAVETPTGISTSISSKVVREVEVSSAISGSLDLSYGEEISLSAGQSGKIEIKAKSNDARAHPFRAEVYLATDDSVNAKDEATLIVKTKPSPYVTIRTDKYMYQMGEEVKITAYISGIRKDVEENIDALITRPDGKKETVDLSGSCTGVVPMCICKEGEYCKCPIVEPQFSCTFTGIYRNTTVLGDYKVEASNLFAFTTTAGISADLKSITSFRVIDLTEASKYLIQKDIGKFSYAGSQIGTVTKELKEQGVMAMYSAIYKYNEKENIAKAVSSVIIFDTSKNAQKFISGNYPEKQKRELFGEVIYFIPGRGILWSNNNILVIVTGWQSGKEIFDEIELVSDITEVKEVMPAITTAKWTKIESGGSEGTGEFTTIKIPVKIIPNDIKERGEALEVIRAYLIKYPSEIAKPICGDTICETEEKEGEFYCPVDCKDRPSTECEELNGYCIFWTKECKENYIETGGKCSSRSEKCCFPEKPFTCDVKCRDLGFSGGKCQQTCSEDEKNIGSGFCLTSTAKQECCCSYEAVPCINGCSYDSKCIPFGSRLKQQGKLFYCSLITSALEEQQETDAECQNDYECKSNSCLEGKCTELKSLIKKLLDALKRIF